MNNCGLPKGYEDRCCLNRNGMCTLDTADYSDIDRAVGMRGCGFIGVNDRYMLWKYGVPYKGFVCGNCQHYRGEVHGVCTTDRDHGYSNSRYSGAHACGDFKKREGEDMAKQTYYTKCGREFQKNSTAEVTGYEIKEEVAYIDTPPYAGRITDDKCRICPFIVDVTEGWGENKKHVRFECRAGSQPPNHIDDWQGSTEDKLTLSIRSLHNDFLESVLEYCKEQPELQAGYTQDRADCRRAISVSCSSNKKGIAAKKALIEKFFPIVEAVPEERYENEACCANCGTKENDCQPYQACMSEGLKPEECVCEDWDGSLEDEIYKDQLDELLNEGEDADMSQLCSQYGKSDCHRNDDAPQWCLKSDEASCKYYAPKPVSESPENVAESLEIVNDKADIVSFDYSTVDIETADFLQDKANKITEIRMKSVMSIGKELKEVHNRLASYDKNKGTYMAWVKSIGISWDTANNYIRAFDYVSENFGMIDSADQIQPSLLFAVSKPSAPKELQEQVLSGDVKTLKEYKELEDKLKAVTYEKKMYMEQAKEAENRANAKERALAGFKEDINNYQQEIGHLNTQLNSKPLEVQATTIKEVVPAEVQAELQRLTTENRFLSEQQTSTSKAIDFIIQGAARSEAELKAYIAIAKSEIPKFSQTPPAVKDTVYQSLSALKCFVLDLENVTRQFKE